MSETAYRQYICRACGLIYDEAEGDPDSGLAPGTRFEDIPNDWECPLCGVTKSDFELLEKRKPVAVDAPTNFTRATGIVVVGGGLAGWATVEAIRELDTQIPITLVSGCSGDRYHKPELSIALSRGLTAKKLIRESANQAAARLGIHLLNNTFATGLTPATHQLRTTRGTLNYTHLILAQGARPQVPVQLNNNTCWRINDLRGWNALAQQLQFAKQHVAIIGAGMIGCEIAEDIASAGHNVTLINRDAFPLAHLLPQKAGMRLLESLTRQGIQHVGEATIESCTATLTTNGNKKPMLVISEGIENQSNQLQFDQIIVATGLRTENRLAQQAGLEFNNGIVVHPQTLRTNHESIYALGDCISINGEPCRFIEPIIHQARTIAHNLLENDLSENKQLYQHQPPVVRLKTKSLPVELHGLPNPNQPWNTLVDTHDELVMEQRTNGEVNAQLKLVKPGQSKAA